MSIWESWVILHRRNIWEHLDINKTEIIYCKSWPKQVMIYFHTVTTLVRTVGLRKSNSNSSNSSNSNSNNNSNTSILRTTFADMFAVKKWNKIVYQLIQFLPFILFTLLSYPANFLWLERSKSDKLQMILVWNKREFDQSDESFKERRRNTSTKKILRSLLWMLVVETNLKEKWI